MLHTATNQEPARPVLRYHGGKFLLAPWIVSHFPEHRVYTEAYGGAASVLMRKPRTYAEIYNDLDGEICSLFRVLRNPAEARELKRVLELTPFARVEFEQSYLPDGDPIEQGRRTVIRSFMGFGSAAASGNATGFRNNANRSGTTPAHDWVNYASALDIFTERLQGVVVENRPAIKVIKSFDQTDALHYVDPPYVHETRGLKNPYCKKGYRFEMSNEQHAELSNELKRVEGMVVLSGYACALYDDLYQGWNRYERPSMADGARPRTEVLWLNASAQDGLQRGRAQGGLFSTQREDDCKITTVENHGALFRHEL